ncbi:MAG TPA: cysteine desulfurase NifS [Candidatus Methylacidiphilales bacterium]|jgi:cysteine desulfurase|nr:cysteine desulfurase NifS [Candidatus Methylacidiphilales bacterium]
MFTKKTMHASRPEVVYLDNNATTRVAPEVFEAMVPFLTEYYGNPSSVYSFGKKVEGYLIEAREKVAALVGATAKEIIFTSCGTESDNAAIWSTLQTTGKRHIVTTQVEHSAIMNQTDALERMGFGVTRLPVAADGTLKVEDVERAIRDDTAIVSVMWANNETGVLFPVEEIATMVKRKRQANEAAHPDLKGKIGPYFHTDAVQTPGKIDLRGVAKSDIDFLSMSGHKLHAPKGVGVLYVKRRTKVVPFVIGGGQERGKRGGTENVASIVGLGRAAELALERLEDEQKRVRGMRDRFEDALLARLPHIYINGRRDLRLPNTTNIAFDFVEAEAVLVRLDGLGICASSGSACTTGSLDPSHVLSAMGLTPARARSCVRFSFSHFNTDADIDYALEVIPPLIEQLRAMSPLSPEHPDNFAYDVAAAREKEEKLMAQTMAAINE